MGHAGTESPAISRPHSLDVDTVSVEAPDVLVAAYGADTLVLSTIGLRIVGHGIQWSGKYSQVRSDAAS